MLNLHPVIKLLVRDGQALNIEANPPLATLEKFNAGTVVNWEHPLKRPLALVTNDVLINGIVSIFGHVWNMLLILVAKEVFKAGIFFKAVQPKNIPPQIGLFPNEMFGKLFNEEQFTNMVELLPQRGNDS